MYEPTTYFATETVKGRGHDRAQAIDALTGGQPVVYALRLADGTIKIGHSGAVTRRRNHFNEAEIIAFRVGDVRDEQGIHQQLVAHRSNGREYYHPHPEVMAVVNDMRDDFGLPHIAA